MHRFAAAVVVLATVAPTDLRAQLRVSRAQPSTVDASAGLATAIDRVASRGGTAWIAWTAPRVDERGTSCCWSDGCQGCWLEGEAVRGIAPGAAEGNATPVPLEADREFAILVRVDAGAVDRIRNVSASCPLDAGGLPFYTLTNVSATQGLSWLEAQARKPLDAARTDDRARAAVHAIALHRGAEADAVLDRLLSAGTAVRRDVVMVLGRARGASGLARLERLVRDEPDEDVRRRAVTSIGMSGEARARTLLLDLARRHADARVRADALVAVARLAGRDTMTLLTDALARDPDTDVKRKAVFGISRLPTEESVPLLIKVARDHTNPEVRKSAMFWLGQSKDPRAVEFFASVLK